MTVPATGCGTGDTGDSIPIFSFSHIFLSSNHNWFAVTAVTGIAATGVLLCATNVGLWVKLFKIYTEGNIMAKLDHGRATRRILGEKAVQRKEREDEAEYQELFGASRSELRRGSWDNFPDTDLGDITAPELPFQDMGMFYSLMLKRYAHGKPESQTRVGKQMQFVANRLCNLKPIGPDRDSREFYIIVDRHKVFERFELVFKDRSNFRRVRYSSRIVAVTDTLDCTIPYKYKYPEIGIQRLQECLRNMVIPDNCDFQRKAQVYIEYANNWDF